MFLYEVVGYVCNSEIYCPEHTPSTAVPIFAEHAQPGDYCVECLAEYEAEMAKKPIQHRYKAATNAPWVFLEGCQPVN